MKIFFLVTFAPVIFVFSVFCGSASLIFLELFGVPIYYLRPRYFPCKGWKKVAAAYVILLLISANFFVFSKWLHEEKISSLIKVEGTLYRDYGQKNDTLYYLRNELNRRQSGNLKFLLCDISRPEKYLSENLTVWYNGNAYVYQMQIGDEIIVSIDDANKNVWYGNLRHFDGWGVIVIVITLFCLVELNILNNNYKK